MYSEDINTLLTNFSDEYPYLKILMTDGNTFHAKTDEIMIYDKCSDTLLIQRPNEDYIIFIDTLEISKILFNKKRLTL